MKKINRTALIIALFVIAIVAFTAIVIALSVMELKAHKHDYSEQTVAPTCVDEGYTLRTCDCGNSYKDQIVGALGHDYCEEFYIDVQPQCTAVGSKSRHCSRCESTTEVTEIPANGHLYGEWETVIEPSCTRDGEIKRTCEVCKKSETQYPETLGHDVRYVVDEYYHEWFCSRCEEKEPKTKHIFEDTVCADCEFEVHPTQGLEYELNDDGRSYTVKGIGTATDANIVIFSEYNGLPVTDVGWGAFERLKNIESICLYGVTAIHDYAFGGASNLKKVVLPDTLTSLVARAFYYDHNLEEIAVDEANPVYYSVNNCLIHRESKSLRLGGCRSVIPDDGSVTSIGSYAFDGRSGMTELSIPNTISSIGEQAFESCYGLTRLEIPSSVVKLDSGAFRFCDNLVSLKLSAGLEEIGSQAFYGCEKLTEVEIPSSVKSIGYNSFCNCTELSKVVIRSGVQSISGGAFGNTAITEIFIPKTVTQIGSEINGGNFLRGCDNLVSITAESGNPVYHSEGNCIIETATSVLRIGCGASVIPDDGSVTVIGAGAFEGCGVITELNLPSCVTEIGSSAYASCNNIINLIIPESLKTVGVRAFANCKGLTGVEIPGSLAKVSNSMFYFCENLESVTIGEGVEVIGPSAFIRCTNLKSVEIPSSVTEIGMGAFRQCNSLESITIPGSVTVIENSVLMGCANLKKVVLEEGVEEIKYSAFRGCTALEEISLPKSLSSEKYLADSAFANCTLLKVVNYAGTVEEWNGLNKTSDFYSVLPADCRVVCADGSVLMDGTILPTE